MRLRSLIRAPAALAVAIGLGTLGAGGAGAEQQATGRLVVNQQLVHGAHDYRYGSRARLRIRAADGRTLVLHRGRRQLSRRLPAGSYRLDSWQRPCADAACRRLRPATDRCRLTVGLGAGQQVVAAVLLRPGHGCSLETADPPASLAGA